MPPASSRAATGQEVPIGTNQQRRMAMYLGPDRWWSDPVTEVVTTAQRLDLALLRGSLDAMMRRHTGLRTYFHVTDGSAGARLMPAREARWPLHVHDVPAGPLSGAERARVLSRLEKNFDPCQPPLVRAVLLREPHRDWLGLAFDHAVFDGGSLTPFLTDLSTVYAHLERGAPAGLVDGVRSRSTDFYGRERQWLDSSAGRRSHQFWARQWSGLASPAQLGLPDGPAAGSATPSPRSEQRSLDSRLVRCMRANAVRLNLTRFMQVAVAVAVAVRRRRADDDVALSFIFSRRIWPGTREVIGFLSCPVLLRLTVGPRDTIDSLGRQVQVESARSVQHGMFSYDQVLREFYPGSYAVRPLLPHLTINVLRLNELSALSLGSISLQEADIPGGQAGDLGPGLHITLIETADSAVLLGTHRSESMAVDTVQLFMDDVVDGLCAPMSR